MQTMLLKMSESASAVSGILPQTPIDWFWCVSCVELLFAKQLHCYCDFDMDLSQFPLEVLEVMAPFLSVSDLSACSAVSHSWRDAFNLDLFWRPHCPEPRFIRYLGTEGGQVRPRLNLSRYDALPPVCDCRAHQMRRVHLLRHWSKGCYCTHELRFETMVVNCTIGADNEGRHWLAVNLSDRTEIWNVQTTPTLHAVVSNITSAPSHLGIAGGKLILVDFSYFVQAFHLQLPTLGFAASGNFFYTDSESSILDLMDDKEREAVQNRMRSSFPKGHFVFNVDNLLIGYCSFVESPNEYFLHVWNVETETKLCQESMLNALGDKAAAYNSASAYISADPQTEQLLCSLYLFNKYVSKLAIYDVKRQRFTKFGLTITGKVDWCRMSEGFVVTSYLLHQLHIYSVGSGSLINVLDTNARSLVSPECGLQNLVLGPYVVQPSRECVRVVNAWCHWDSLLLHFRSVFRIVAVTPKLLAVIARPYAVGSKVFLEVWNVETKVRLFDYLVADCDRPAFHSIQPLLTKMVIALDDSVTVLSFW